MSFQEVQTLERFLPIIVRGDIAWELFWLGCFHAVQSRGKGTTH